MRFLTTLYLTDHRAQVRSDHRSLVVVGGDGARSRVPVDALEAVVMVGHGQIIYRFDGSIASARTSLGRRLPRELGQPWIL